jgi:hypothetical protein
MLLLSEGQTGEAQESSNKEMLFQESGNRRREKGDFYFYII